MFKGHRSEVSWLVMVGILQFTVKLLQATSLLPPNKSSEKTTDFIYF